METWTSIPSSAIQKIVEGVKKMNLIREKSLDEISEWRDRMLVKLLKFIDQEKI